MKAFDRYLVSLCDCLFEAARWRLTGECAGYLARAAAARFERKYGEQV
jgi:hypothetical protein